MGPTAMDVLSPTPPVECLSTTFRPSAAPRSRVSPERIIASVSAWVSLSGEAVEVDGHAPRGHLVVRHLVAGIRENQLRELRGVVLLPVSLVLDELGRPHHPPFVATKTHDARRERRGSSYGAISGGSSASSESDEAADERIVLDRDPPVGVAALDGLEVPFEDLGAVLAGEDTVPRGLADEDAKLLHVALAVRDRDEAPAGREDA